MRAIIYARVSTEEQAEEGYSLDAQIEKCKERCKQKGWTIVKILREEGRSAKDIMGRPKFLEAIQMLKNGEADVIVSWRQDRITRSNFDMQWLLKEVGFKFSFVVGGDFLDPRKKFEIDIRAAVAEEERRKISEATRLGLERRKKQGLPVGWPKGKPRKVTPEIKQKMKEYYFKDGMTYQQIIDRIKEEYNISVSLWTVSQVINSEL